MVEAAGIDDDNVSGNETGLGCNISGDGVIEVAGGLAYGICASKLQSVIFSIGKAIWLEAPPISAKTISFMHEPAFTGCPG